MNRKTFLATIAAMLSAPFVKAKEKEPDWKKANPVILKMRKDVIKGSDLIYILEHRQKQGTWEDFFESGK